MSDQIDNKTQDLFVSEEQDGTALVSLPADLAPEPVEAAPEPAAHEDEDAADAAAEAAEIAANGSVDPEQDAIRAAKRAKRKARKEYHRQVQTEKDIRLQNLQRQNQELLERLSVIEKKTQSSELARVDKAIEDQQLRVDFAKRKMQEATESMNGELLTQAQEMWFEARREVEAHRSLTQWRSGWCSLTVLRRSSKIRCFSVTPRHGWRLILGTTLKGKTWTQRLH